LDVPICSIDKVVQLYKPFGSFPSSSEGEGRRASLFEDLLLERLDGEMRPAASMVEEK
jgi:hypothetical protein